MKIILIFTCLLISFMSCGESNKKFVSTDSVNVSMRVISDSVVQNQYIVSIKDSVAKIFFSKLDDQIQDYLQAISVIQKMYEKEFLTNKNIDAKIAISSPTRFGFLITCDSNVAKELRKDERIDDVSSNKIIKYEFPELTLIEIQSEDLPWGVQRVSSSSKPNGTYKSAWIIDTGIDSDHSDLNVDILNSRSFVPGESLEDNLGHGTHVAGIIGAKVNGSGVIGVAPNANLIALKVFNAQSYLDYGNSYLPALNYVLQNAQAGHVLNLSLQGTIGTLQEIQLIKSIAGKGVFVTIAAGNYKKDVDNADIYPAKINGNNIYTLSAFNSGDNYWKTSQIYGSNFGNSVDYSAPGVMIKSTYRNNTYAIDTGTSMAAPHLAGLLLLKGSFGIDGNVKGDPDGKIDPIVHE